MSYPTDLTYNQRLLMELILSPYLPRPRKYDIFSIINAIMYVSKTGCQWYMLPNDFPPYRVVYHHWRSMCEHNVMGSLLKSLVMGHRAKCGKSPEPHTCVVDSESVRWGVINSEKGVDGHKKVKGVKRHIAVDEYGLPLCACVTAANVNDAKGAEPLLTKIIRDWTEIEEIKADKGYRGLYDVLAEACSKIHLQTVKSNFGTPEFIPIDGRWVVERTFSWLGGTRRLMRNYEKYLHTATHMATTCMVFFMLRFFG